MQLHVTVDPVENEIEAGRLLRTAATAISTGICHGTLTDLADNQVGEWHLTMDTEAPVRLINPLQPEKDLLLKSASNLHPMPDPYEVGRQARHADAEE